MILNYLDLYPEKIDKFLEKEKADRIEKQRLREERLKKE
jgi:hypothetical protein